MASSEAAAGRTFSHIRTPMISLVTRNLPPSLPACRNNGKETKTMHGTTNSHGLLQRCRRSDDPRQHEVEEDECVERVIAAAAAPRRTYMV